MRTRLFQHGAALSSAAVLIAGIMTTGAAAAVPAAGAAAGPLPLLPDGLNVAIGARATANSGSAPGTSLGNVDDGDGTTRWCPSALGIHSVTLDLGRVVNMTGTGVTFSGEEGSDGSFYSISTGTHPPRPDAVPQPGAGQPQRDRAGPAVPVGRDDIRRQRDGAGPLRDADLPGATGAEHLRHRNCACSPAAPDDTELELGDDLSALAADTGDLHAERPERAAAEHRHERWRNYARLRLLVDPAGCGTSCLDLANDLSIASKPEGRGHEDPAGHRVLRQPDQLDRAGHPGGVGRSEPAALSSTVQAYTESVIKAFAMNGTPYHRSRSATRSRRVSCGRPGSWPRRRVRTRQAGARSTTLLEAASRGRHRPATRRQPAGGPARHRRRCRRHDVGRLLPPHDRRRRAVRRDRRELLALAAGVAVRPKGEPCSA